MASRFHVSALGLAAWIASSVLAPIAGCAEGEQLDPDSLGASGTKHGSGGKGGSNGIAGSMPSLPAGGASGSADQGSGGTSSEGGNNGSGGNGNVADSSTPATGGSAGQSGSAGTGGTATMPMDAAIVPPDAPLAKGILVLYHAANTSPTDDTISFFFKVANNGTTAVPIGALKTRYYFTDELNGAGKNAIYESFVTSFPTEGAHTDYAALTKQTVTRVTLANSYLEFTVNTADLLQPNFALTMQVAYAATGGQPLDESNDYSVNLSQSTYAQTVKMVVFQGTTVVAGGAPPY